MALMKTASFDSDQQAWFSKLEQKVLASRISLNSKPIDLPEYFLERHALAKRITKGKPITWLLAPAGYGKSVALSNWYNHILEQTEQLGVWLSLDRKDNQEAFFLRHVLETINQLIPGIATDALALWLARQEQSSDEEVLNGEDILLLLLDELKDLNCPVVLIFDNLHFLDDPAAWGIVEYLMVNLPQNMRLILSSRYIPVSLGRLRLDPKLEFIKTDELAFSPQEVSTWLAAADIRDPQQALMLSQRMQGWPAGLGLWILSLQDGESLIEQVSQKQGILTDYLVGEVLNDLDETEKSFLIKIAPLENFNEGLCNHVLGIDDSRHWIQQLVQHNIFIDSIDLQSGWYRLHPMLVELLGNFTTQKQQKQVHISAFNFLKQEGFRVEALQHARLGGLADEAVAWIESEVNSIIADLDFSSVLSWCEIAGEDLLSQSLHLQLVHTWSLLLTYQYQQAAEKITHIDSAQIELDYPGQLLAIKGYIARLEGDEVQARSLCELALKELPQDRFAIRVLMCSTLVNLELVRKNPEAARIWNRLEIDIARSHNATGLELLAQFDYARVELFRGHISRSADVVAQGLVLAKEVSAQQRLFPRARLILHRALVRWLNGRKDAALEDAYAGIDEASNCRDITVLHGYSLIALIYMSDQKVAEALDLMAQAERLMQRWKVSDVFYQPWIETIKANAWMLLGKWRRAEQALELVANNLMFSKEDATEHKHSEFFPMLSGFYRLSAARLMLHQKQYKQAHEILKPVIQYGQAGVIQLAAYLLSAALYSETNQLDKAKESWQQGMSFAEKENIKVEIDAYIPGLANALSAKYLESSLEEAYDERASQVLAAESSNLSMREKEVLSLIADGFSNQGIADQLFISLHTVKTHARKINAKLGAKSRTQAIVKARELAII